MLLLAMTAIRCALSGAVEFNGVAVKGNSHVALKVQTRPYPTDRHC